VKAHRSIQSPALNYDALHAEHHHRGEHLLPLPCQGTPRKRHE